MAQIKNKDFTVEMQIKAIELLNLSLQAPTDPNISIETFNFNIHIESKADAKNKLVFVILHIEITNIEHLLNLGAISVSCIFEIANFEEVIKVDNKGVFDLPKALLETLNIITISTTRGIMYSTFKGTFLNGAILPIIDPKQFHVGKEIIEK